MLAQVFKAGHSGATFGGIGTLDMALFAGYASGLDIALDDDRLAAWYAAMSARGFTSGKLKGGRDTPPTSAASASSPTHCASTPRTR